MSGIPVLKGRSKQQRYEALVDSYYGDVYRYGFWLCKNQPLAEDLVQETFLRAWRSLDSLQDEKPQKRGCLPYSDVKMPDSTSGIDQS